MSDQVLADNPIHFKVRNTSLVVDGIMQGRVTCY